MCEGCTGVCEGLGSMRSVCISVYIVCMWVC